MGIKFMAAAIDAEVANSGQKLVLIMLANHCNDHTRQCNPSHKLLAQECSMGLSTLKGHINALVDAGFVSINHVFVDSIQKPNNYILNLIAPRSESGYPPVRIGLPPGQNLATEPEVKPEDNHIGHQKQSLFEEFWKAYPRKVGPALARKSFAKLKVDQELLQKMLKAIEQQKKTDQWKDTKFIPHPSTWLNGERWEDEVVVKPQTASDRELERLFR